MLERLVPLSTPVTVQLGRVPAVVESFAFEEISINTSGVRVRISHESLVNEIKSPALQTTGAMPMMYGSDKLFFTDFSEDELTVVNAFQDIMANKMKNRIESK